jgi:hypothetical protein
MQAKGEHRGFNCPLTEEPCTEGDCLKGQRCCDADRQGLAKAREVADKQGRQYPCLGHGNNQSRSCLASEAPKARPHAIQSNNKAVVFRGKAEHEMPSVSQAQNRFMHAVAAGNVEDVPKSVGKEFVKADHGRKISKLPGHVHKHAKHDPRGDLPHT